MPTPLLARAACIDDLKERARRRIPRFAFDYLEGGCNWEVGLERNRQALDAVVLEPRYLEAHEPLDLATTLFGREYAAPFGVSPVGLGGIMWPKVHEILAEAAAEANIPFVLSTVATTAIERAAELAGECFWFQLYTPNDPSIRNALLDRAAATGCQVLAVTVDVPVSGWRPRDLRNGLAVPPRFDLRTVYQVATRPIWALATARAGVPHFENLVPYMPKDVTLGGVGGYLRKALAGGVDRERLAQIRDRWHGKLIVKGVTTVRDALIALEVGADGIMVSNHGARQLDGDHASVEVLPAICAAVGDRATVIADSGVKGGPDIARMLAKGATSVFAGRAFMYGVAGLGRPGGRYVIELLREELEQVMHQLRCGRPADLCRHLPGAAELRPAPHAEERVA